MTHIEFMAAQEQRIEDAWRPSIASHQGRKLLRNLRKDLTEEQKTEARRIGRIEFRSAGATRKR